MCSLLLLTTCNNGGKHLLRTFNFISLIFHIAFKVLELDHKNTAVNGAIRIGGWVSLSPKPTIFPPRHTVLIAAQITGLRVVHRKEVQVNYVLNHRKGRENVRKKLGIATCLRREMLN